MTLTAPIRSDNDMNAEIPRGKAFCCYILASDRWPTPYTGKTCDLAQRLHRHNNPSPRSRAYTKGKGPWRVAAAVFGLRSNRQSVWLERALKKHAKHRARPAGLNAAQTAVLHAVRVASRPSTWWPKGQTRAARAAAASATPTLHVHIFKAALAPHASASSSSTSLSLSDAVADDSACETGANTRLVVHCHHQHDYAP